MTPEYLRELADLADPEKLWMMCGLDQLELPKEKRQQLDIGMALRRQASHTEQLNNLLNERRSLLITPLSASGCAVKSIDTPIDHEKLRHT